MNKAHLALGLLAAVVLATGVALRSPSDLATGTSSLASPAVTTEDSGVHKTVNVTYTDTGFNPSVVSIKKGDSVLFVNASGKSLRIAPIKDPKDATSGYLGFEASRSIRKGETFGVTVTMPGIWGYKNLNSPTTVGIVIAE